MRNLATVVLIQFLILSCQEEREAITNGAYYYATRDFEQIPGDPLNYRPLVDSVVFFYEKSGDTLTYWTPFLERYIEPGELMEIERQEGFGKYLQKGLTLSDGRITIHELTPKKFLVRGDSLFIWDGTYKISKDSMAILRNTYKYEITRYPPPLSRLPFTATIDLPTADARKFDEIMQANEEPGFIFIFNTALFDTGLKQVIRDKKTKCFHTVTLFSKWETVTNDYYWIEVLSECGQFPWRWAFILSKDLEFIAFGGYGRKETRMLTEAKIVINNKPSYLAN